MNPFSSQQAYAMTKITATMLALTQPATALPKAVKPTLARNGRWSSLTVVATMVLSAGTIRAVDYTAEDITVKRANANPNVQVVTTSAAAAQFPYVRIADYQTTGPNGYPKLFLESSAGTQASPLAVPSGYYLGGVEFRGYPGTGVVFMLSTQPGFPRS